MTRARGAARYPLRMKTLLLAPCLLACSALAAPPAPDEAQAVLDLVDAAAPAHVALARELWQAAELGFQERRSADLLCAALEQAGFRVTRGVAGMPTAFVAEWGSGRPVLGVLGEFDALPGMSQRAQAAREPVREGAPGHACGHNLFAPASLAAVLAAQQRLAARGGPGTLRFYGTPAEEGGGGKLYMLRAGLFDDADAVLAWHPADRNDPTLPRSLAVVSATFTFHGRAAHASVSPEKGRSALDGVEAFTFMVNLMREHVPPDARLHYVITDGGSAPNIVPEHAAVSLYVRHPDLDVLEGLWSRVLQAAEGAALGTGTSMEWELESAYWPLLGNAALTAVQEAAMRRVGGVSYAPDELAFAQQLAATLPPGGLPIGSQEGLSPPESVAGRGSTDVGDVSWVVPTTQFFAATWVPGTPAHTWQAVACSGSTLGEKGMLVAAKTLALTLDELLRDPEHVRRAREEFERARGGREYRSRIGEREPPLGYREGW